MEKEINLQEELLEKVSGGAGGIKVFVCPHCGTTIIYSSEEEVSKHERKCTGE